jgi:YD repeat-containing protein
VVHEYNATGSGGLPESGTYQTLYLNTSEGWATSTAYTLPYIINNPTGSSTVTYQELANFQGNGQQDQDVLSTITYPHGGSTSITYGYTTESGTNSQIPYNLLVVTATVNHDGLGNNVETDYAYTGGRQYFPTNVFDRKFAGFASIAASSSLASITTYYSQGATSSAIVAGDQSDGYGELGFPYRQDTFTPSGTRVQTIFYQYNSITHGGGQFVGLTRQLEQDYASSGTHQDKDTDYVYSTSTDNLLQINDYGAVTGNSDGTFTDITGDSRTTNITYAASSSVNLSVPTEKTLLNNSAATTTDAKFFYDGLSFGQVNVGNQTQEQDWITGTTYASSTKTYNSYGLVATSTDRDGNATAYNYDSFNMYPATTTNALLQSTKYTYEYSNGKTATTTNPNGGITKNTYDGLGRLIEVDQSNPASPSTLATSTTYQFTDSSTAPSVIQETDYLNSATSTNIYSYYDGLDRLIQKRKSTESSATSSVTDLIYNTAGQLASQSLPYFALSSSAPTSTSAVVNVIVIGGGGGGGSIVTSLGGGGGGGTSSFGSYCSAAGGGGGGDGNNGNLGTVHASGGGGGGGEADGNINLGSSVSTITVTVGTGGVYGNTGTGGSGLFSGGNSTTGQHSNGGGGGGSTANGGTGDASGNYGTGGSATGGGGGGGDGGNQHGGSSGAGISGGAGSQTTPGSGGGVGAGGGGAGTGAGGGGGGGQGVGCTNNNFGGGGGAGSNSTNTAAAGGGGGSSSGANGSGSTGGTGGTGNNGGNGGNGGGTSASSGGSGGGTYSSTYGMGGAAGSSGTAGAVIVWLIPLTQVTATMGLAVDLKAA